MNKFSVFKKRRVLALAVLTLLVAIFFYPNTQDKNKVSHQQTKGINESADRKVATTKESKQAKSEETKTTHQKKKKDTDSIKVDILGGSLQQALNKNLSHSGNITDSSNLIRKRISSKGSVTSLGFSTNVDYVDNHLKVLPISKYESNMGEILRKDKRYIYFKPSKDIDTTNFLTVVYKNSSPLLGRASGLIGVKLKNNKDAQSIASDLSLAIEYQNHKIRWAYFKHNPKLGLANTAKEIHLHPKATNVILEANFGWLTRQ